LNTKEYLAAKVAAMEGNWETDTGVPLILFAIPDEEALREQIQWPKLASLHPDPRLEREFKALMISLTEDGEVPPDDVSQSFSPSA
jgi:cytochrome d ubiquinol oxidase subunit I